ncbi:MAG TPA: glycosyltransferase [Thermoleophilaceae bacterium]
MARATKPRTRQADVVPIEHVHVAPLAIERFFDVLSAEQKAEFEETISRGRELLAGRVVWSVNSTAKGGGVAELLRSLMAYARAGGVDARWVVIGGEADFFRVTKRIHNHLHGWAGDGGPLGELERAIYESACAGAARQLAELVKPGDIVLLHDPQTAGLTAALKQRGAHVIWRAHVGLDLPNDYARDAWAFLQRYVEPAEAYVFSRQAYAWEPLDPDRVIIIPPSIDPFSPKNEELDAPAVRAILEASGMLADGASRPAVYLHQDGTPGRIDRHVELVGNVGLPDDTPLVTQVSRWDRLKDPLGLIESFVTGVAHDSDAHLLLAGPETSAVADDPEGAGVLNACIERWHSLAPEMRPRIHLALLPMADTEENAAMVNAIQRWSTVVVQKSLAEGFGLTVAEAMWKGKPVVAGAVGGIQDQIVNGESGLLVPPEDLRAFGEAMLGLLLDPERAEQIGRSAQERVRQEFLGSRHLRQYVDLFERVIGGWST